MSWYQQQTVFENIVGKEEITRKEQVLLFPQCFLLNQKIVFPFVHIFDIKSLCAAEVKEPKIGISGTGIDNESYTSLHYMPRWLSGEHVRLMTWCL